MRHDRACVCQECAGVSASDTMLVGLTMIAAVVLAITTASRLMVLFALIAVAGLAVHKLRRTVPKPPAGKGSAAKQGVASAPTARPR